MIVRCGSCEKFFDDEFRWTICPHNSLSVGASAGYCREHDLYVPCAACMHRSRSAELARKPGARMTEDQRRRIQESLSEIPGVAEITISGPHYLVISTIGDDCEKEVLYDAEDRIAADLSELDMEFRSVRA